MIRVSVLYPAGEGKTFDFDYYTNSHVGLCKKVLGCERFEVDKAVTGPYLAAGHLYFSTMEAMQAGMGGPDAGQAQADVVNYTNTIPVVQISEVVA